MNGYATISTASEAHFNEHTPGMEAMTAKVIKTNRFMVYSLAVLRFRKISLENIIGNDFTVLFRKSDMA